MTENNNSLPEKRRVYEIDLEGITEMTAQTHIMSKL